MTDPDETTAPVTTDRAFSTADLAYINRMTTTGMVLPVGCARGQQLAAGHRRHGRNPGPSWAVAARGGRQGARRSPSRRPRRPATCASSSPSPARRRQPEDRAEGRGRARRLAAALLPDARPGRVTIDAPAEESLVARADSQHVVQVLVNLRHQRRGIGGQARRAHRPRPVMARTAAAPTSSSSTRAPGFEDGHRTAGGAAVPDDQAGGRGGAGARRRQAPRRSGRRHARVVGGAGRRDGLLAGRAGGLGPGGSRRVLARGGELVAEVQAMELVDQRRAAQLQQARRLPLVAARLLEAAHDQLALEL